MIVTSRCSQNKGKNDDPTTNIKSTQIVFFITRDDFVTSRLFKKTVKEPVNETNT